MLLKLTLYTLPWTVKHILQSRYNNSFGLMLISIVLIILTSLINFES